MNGAEAMLATLADNGVEVCFANPGTSEMQFVTALDREPRVRSVLGLFEGVVTGAADGYGRMAGKPAVTLLHLGPGYLNGAANLHNARRAFTPVVNVIGDHATYHRQYDAPLTSDIAGMAGPNSLWLRVADTADAAADLAAEAVQASFGPPAGPVSLILPADSAWTPTDRRGPTLTRATRPPPAPGLVEAAARQLRAASKPVLLLGSGACNERGLRAASRLSGLGVRVITDTFLARLPRGAGRFAPDRMLYFSEVAVKDLAGSDLMILVETTPPVAFFAYPETPSILTPEGCVVLALADRSQDGAIALEQLAETMGAPAHEPSNSLETPDAPTGQINAHTVGVSLARHLPSQAVISDDAATSSLPIFTQTKGARPHDWLSLTGGAIGQGLPVAVGAAVASPGRKVVSLSGDGSAMYTVQALWTLAREALDVTVVIFANHSYRILGMELARTGAGEPGAAAANLLSLDNPRIDWVQLGSALGLPSVRCTTAESFDSAFSKAMAGAGPSLIEVLLA